MPAEPQPRIAYARDLQDIAVFESLFGQYAEMLYRYALLRVGSREDAEDILSVTFARIWEYGQRYPDRPIRSIKALLYHTAGNITVDHWRRKRPALSLDVLLEQGLEFAEDKRLGEEEKTDVAMVVKAFRVLPPVECDLLMLRFIEDLPLSEIAEIHDMTENHVAVKIHRALKKVREQLCVEEK